MVNTHLSNILLYTCTFQELEAYIVPTTLLPHNHPFYDLLLSHLQTLTSTGKYDSVIDALIAVHIGDPKWRSKSSPERIVTHRKAIRKLLIEQTPIFAMVEQNTSDCYGFHIRNDAFRNYIFVTKEYVDVLCKKKDDNHQLAIEALLKSTVNHELAHWLLIQRVGPYHPDYLDALSHPPKQRQAALMKLSPRLFMENKEKETPKDFRAFWADSDGEAGRYVEIHSQGGIIGFNLDEEIANIEMGNNVQYILPESYLLKFREGHSIQFVPTQPEGPQCSTQASPSTQHQHSKATSQSFQPGVGLGIGCAWRSNVRKITDEILALRVNEESVVE